MREDSKTLLFAAAVCVTCSLLLSGTAAGLRSRQLANEAYDIQRNILKAFGKYDASMKQPQVKEIYQKHVTRDEACGRPLFTWTEEGAQSPSKYAFPIDGKGLWGDIYGYIALESDMETIAGISFYKHGETPGLGAEIEKSWFTDQFRKDKLYSNGVATNFRIVKSGGDSDKTSVNGISGATLTGKGVQQFLVEDAKAYANYLNSIREK